MHHQVEVPGIAVYQVQAARIDFADLHAGIEHLMQGFLYVSDRSQERPEVPLNGKQSLGLPPNRYIGKNSDQIIPAAHFQGNRGKENRYARSGRARQNCLYIIYCIPAIPPGTACALFQNEKSAVRFADYGFP